MTADNIKILIVEDDSDLLESTAACLTLAGFQVTAVGTARAFYSALEQSRYAAAIIDIGLPDQSGLVLVEYLRKNGSIGIIVLTARDSEDDQACGYESGADIYLVKPVASRVLVSAIHRMLERLRHQPDDGSGLEKAPAVLPWLLNLDRWTLVSPQREELRLTSQEFRFLEALVQTDSRSVSRDRLMSSLYNFNDEYTGRALDALVRRLRTKLSRMGTPSQPLRSQYGVGFCFSEPFSTI